MPVNFVNIPDVLKQTASFCVWKMEKRSGRPTKVPYNPRTGAMARTNDPSTFADFNTAMKSYAIGGWDGIGYRVSEGIGAIDIDHCIREDGSLNDVAASILGIFPDAYFEKSPSGTGLRGFFRLSPDFAYDKTVYYINNRKHGLEVYLPVVTNRFVTVTGDMFRNGAVTRNDDALRTLLDTFMKRSTRVSSKTVEPVSYLDDDGVIAHASASESGDKFKALYEGRWEEGYDSQSDADMALVSILAFWCGNVEEQIDRIFRTSGLMRDKWDRMTGDSTYGQITIRNAVSTNGEIYTPIMNGSAEDDFESIDDDEEEAEVLTFEPDLSHITLTIEEMRPHTKPRYQRDEIGIGYAFADYFKPIARFDRERGIWYVYDGKVWQPDENALAVAELAKILADRLYTFALQITDEDTRNRYIKRVQKLQMRKNRRTMIEDAKSVYPVSHTVFDRNTDLFNCQNGTLNLTTGEFRPHDPADFLTMMSGITYDPDATCPRWDQFISEVMCNDADLALYLQKALGYALTGDTSLECLFILYGATSRNGKGTTMETILRILGEYGRTAKPDMLSKKGFADSSGPSEDVARLNGARMVNVSEPEKSMQIDASLTKQMTGNNILTARFLRENSFEFKPQFKLFIDTNHLPQISDMTLFESDRIKIIPFNRHFTAEERDIDLKSFFAKPENLSGILNWCLEGFRLYMTEGLDMPDSVENATKEYRQQSDRIMMFTSQCVKKEIGQELRAQAVYSRYKDWCAENGFKYENAANFRKKMEQAGFVYQRRRPHDEKGAGQTTMVNDIVWVVGEEPEQDFVPENDEA